MKFNTIVVFVALLALIAGIATKGLVNLQNQVAPTPLEDFSLKDLKGKVHSISEWQGQIRIINFWATWCPPCRKEIPDLIALQQNYENRGLTVIGIAIDDPEAVAEFLSTTPITYPLLIATDEGINLSRKLGNTISAIPFTIIIDEQGIMKYKHQGELSKLDIVNIIQPMLK